MFNHVVKEACVENFKGLKNAILKGADRIELNDNMKAWGTTPSLGNIKVGVEYCKNVEVPIIIMNRPREGDFHYSAYEKEVILQDLYGIIESDADGVAFGALNVQKEVDKEFVKTFIHIAKKNNLEVTFHRAFDSIPLICKSKV